MAAAAQISPKRLAANRANALKSTGPRSAAGKQRVAQNACKHHLYARKFLMPGEWQQWALQRAHQFAQTIDDPHLRPLIFQRIYINGRQKYFVHLCAEFFKLANKNGIGWYLANSDCVTALDRYHAHLYAETVRITRLLRRYKVALRAADLPTCPPPCTTPGAANVRERVENTPGRSNPSPEGGLQSCPLLTTATPHHSPRPIKPIFDTS